MSRNVVIGIVIVVVVVILGWYFLRQQGGISYGPTQTQTPTFTKPQKSPQATSAAVPTSGKNVVTISSVGFSPKNITIKAGETAVWKNDDSANHAVNSTPHPIHTDYQPLNLGTIKSGKTKSLQFPTAGTYKYHDHLNPSLTGSVTVE